jgi:cyclopropane fatty-acyl-phospholipid synthase-like methyltransferase
MRSVTLTSYDELPYGDRTHRATDPDLLAVVATLFGMSPAPPDQCRVLELGCAGGGNLSHLAKRLPGSSFVGIDLSERQVSSGREKIRELGLTNVELHAMSILDVQPELGRFDYILCHGVYSWVPSAVRDKILAICATNLMPQGIAYVSYNCYPGWRTRGAVRELMLYHTRRAGDPLDRVRQAREALGFVAASVSNAAGFYGRMIAEEADRLEKAPDDYLFHEYLEDVNDPVYFHEFVEHAAAHRLQYLWEARVGEFGCDLRPEVIQALRQMTPDLISQQQYIDFLTDRRFRSSLLCHDGIVLDRTIPAERMTGFHVVGLAAPQSASPDIASSASEVFQTLEGAGISTNNPVFKAALTCLAQRAPAPLTFRELCAATRDRLRATPVEVPIPQEQIPYHVADLLRQGALVRLFELHMSPNRPRGRAAPARRARRGSVRSQANSSPAQPSNAEDSPKGDFYHVALNTAKTAGQSPCALPAFKASRLQTRGLPSVSTPPGGAGRPTHTVETHSPG